MWKSSEGPGVLKGARSRLLPPTELTQRVYRCPASCDCSRDATAFAKPSHPHRDFADSWRMRTEGIPSDHLARDPRANEGRAEDLSQDNVRRERLFSLEPVGREQEVRVRL